MGVVSGLVITCQFGTNWSSFLRSPRQYHGPLLTYEVLTAFFTGGFERDSAKRNKSRARPTVLLCVGVGHVNVDVAGLPGV